MLATSRVCRGIYLSLYLNSVSHKNRDMAAALKEWRDKSVLIVTSDARILVGTLVGHDNVQNLILNEASEKVFSRDEPPETIDLGLYVVRGDTVCVIGDYNQTKLEEDVRISEPMEALQQQQS